MTQGKKKRRRFRDWLCQMLCGRAPIETDDTGLPPDIRQASHKIANTVSEIQGSTARLHKEVDNFLDDVNGFLALGRGMQNRDERNAS